MSSQEDYLDNLLKDLSGSTNKSENAEEEIQSVAEVFPDVESTTTMSEKDIERLLAESVLPEKEISVDDASGDRGTKESETEAYEIEDLMGMLKKTDDEDLQDIHELLQKSEHNEAVDDKIMSLFQEEDVTEVFDPLADDLEDAEDVLNLAPDEKAQRSEQRRREKKEKKAEKLAKKMAAKEAKLARKAAKTAKKTANTEQEASSEMSTEIEMPTEITTSVADEILPENEIAGLDELLSLSGNSSMETQDSTEMSFHDIFGTSPMEDTESAATLVAEIPENKDAAHKKGFFTRILDFFTEEDEEAVDEEIKLSDENKKVLEELDKNKKKKKKGKKAKKEADVSRETSAEGGEEIPKKEKKAKKEKKPKKENTASLEEMEQTTGGSRSRLSIKRILPIVLICLTVGLVIILTAHISSDYSAKKTGHKAFYSGDYQTCYQNLYGKDLNESEQVMFGKSESILRIRLWIREYELLAEEGLEAEALDSLIQSVNEYPTLYNYSSQWNAGAEVSEIYAQMVGILNEKYHLTETQALEIASAEDDVDYSRMVYAIINGEAFGSWNEFVNKDDLDETQPVEKLPDVLPEEEELEKASFVDNN